MAHRLPDLVRDSELETHFLPDCNTETVHTYHERSPYSRGLVSRSEHWRRLRKIGGGGFGTVWLERRTKGGQHELRAIKQLEINPQSTRPDYSRELEAIAKFSQWKYERCFVKSYGWFQSPEHLFISMEYLELGDLHRYLQQGQPLPEPEAKDISYQILDGLCLMHSNGFIHRDLKLNNILLKSCPPNGWWIKIADFGISKRVEDGLGVPTTTKGTAGYMAPELLGFAESDHPYALDVWAVGEIVFRMLTKKPTFKNPGLLSQYVNNMEVFPVDVLRTAPTSQPGVEFVLYAMHPIPGKRITAEEALQHAWMDQSRSVFTTRTNVGPTDGQSSSSSMAHGSQNEEFASWDTVNDPKAPIAMDGILYHDSSIGRNEPTTAVREKPDDKETFRRCKMQDDHKLVDDSEGYVTTHADASLAPKRTTSRAARPGGKLTAVALDSYNTTEDDELSFPEEAKITDIVFLYKDWWYGSYNARKGLFPRDLVWLSGDTDGDGRHESSTSSSSGGFRLSKADEIFPAFARNSPRTEQRPSTSLELCITELRLPVTLQQLFHGITKGVQIETLDSDGKQVKWTLDVDIKPGMGAGTKLKYKGVGFVSDGRPEDIHIILIEKPHRKFVRQGDNLITTVNINAKETAFGWQRTVPIIDGRRVSVSSHGGGNTRNDILFPGLGMPKLRSPGSRGDFIVHIKTDWMIQSTSTTKHI